MKLKNLLIDSLLQYPRRCWQVDRARVKNGLPFTLSTSDKTFGIHQNIYLTQKGIYYFSVKVHPIRYVKELIIGIAINGVMRASKYYILTNTTKLVSVIADVKDCNDLVSLYIIGVNSVKFSSMELIEPRLYRLDDYYLRFALKSALDKKLEYSPSISYKNLLSSSTLSNLDIEHNNSTLLEQGKHLELVVNTKSSINIKLKCNLTKNSRYLVKILTNNINNQGQTKIIYNNQESINLSKYQQYLIFKYNGEDKPIISIKAKENKVIPYRVSLNKVLLIDITNETLKEDQIKALLYME